MSKQATFDKIDLLGVEIDVITNAEAITSIIERSAPGQPAGYIVKPYVEFLDAAYHDLEIQQLLNDADLAIADGVALVWAAAYLYAGPRTTLRFAKTLVQIITSPHELLWPLTDRAAGINFSLPLLSAAATAGRRVYLVGSPASNTIAHTAKAIQARFPSLIIAGTHTGTDPDATSRCPTRPWLDRLAAGIAESRADIVLLGMGFPRQEFAAAYLTEHLSHGIIIGEGGTFDYQDFGGSRRKAPRWMQRTGLEWLWRLILQPSRFRRQLAIPRFIYHIWRSRH